MLCYCIQIEFTSLVRIKTLCLLYLLSVVEAGWMLWFRFPAWVQFFVSGVTWSVRAPSGNLCCVTSPGKLSSAVVEFVAPLRLWHGPRLHKWLVFKVRVQRTGARWRAQLRGVSEMFKPCSRESESQKSRVLRLARCFNQSNLALPAGGLSNPIVRMGLSPPPHVQAFWGWNLRGPTFQSFRGRYKLTDFICLFSHTWC